MRTEQKTNIKNSVMRLTIIGISVLVQLWWIITLFFRLNQYNSYIGLFSTLLATLLVLWIYSKHENAGMKMPWIILILIAPFMGIVLYFLFGNKRSQKKKLQRFIQIDQYLSKFLSQESDVFTSIRFNAPLFYNQARYLSNTCHFPAYSGTSITYYSDALDGLNAQIEDLRNAKRFIFMEYHAIEYAESFERVLEVLSQKVNEGVEVRIFYDDIGSIGFINHAFVDKNGKSGNQMQGIQSLDSIGRPIYE